MKSETGCKAVYGAVPKTTLHSLWSLVDCCVVIVCKEDTSLFTLKSKSLEFWNVLAAAVRHSFYLAFTSHFLQVLLPLCSSYRVLRDKSAFSIQTTDDHSKLLAVEAIARRFATSFSQQLLTKRSGNTHFSRPAVAEGPLTILWAVAEVLIKIFSQENKEKPKCPEIHCELCTACFRRGRCSAAMFQLWTLDKHWKFIGLQSGSCCHCSLIAWFLWIWCGHTLNYVSYKFELSNMKNITHYSVLFGIFVPLFDRNSNKWWPTRNQTGDSG